MPKLTIDNSTATILPAKVKGAVLRVAPKVRIITMNEVPDPPVAERKSVYTEFFTQIVNLPPGEALEMKFSSRAHADFAKTRFRKLAAARKLTLSSSRTSDNLTRYFWIEKV